MTNTFNIVDFGAIGDGKTDCTNAIQKALDLASACQGIVQIPSGKFLVGSLKMKGNGVSLVGEVAWSYKHDGGSTLILNDENANCLLDISGAFGCNIRSICFDGKNLGKNVHGINLFWEEYNGGGQEDTPSIDNCRVGRFTGDGVHFEHVWCFSIRHSMLHRNHGAGLFMDGWDAFILDNWFSGNQKGGIMGGRVVASVTMTGNRIEWNRVAGMSIGAGNHLNVTGNYFDRSFGPAIIMGYKPRCNGIGVHSSTFTGNILYRSGALEKDSIHEKEYNNCHFYLQNSQGIAFTANSLKTGVNDDGFGNLSPDYGIIIENCTDCVVKDNVLHLGAVKELVVEKDNDNCIIKDNVGRLTELI